MRHGGITNERTRDGRTGLYLLSGNLEEICRIRHAYWLYSEWYLKQGLVGIKDNVGRTALHHVNGNMRDRDTVSHDFMLKLIQEGETLLARDKNGETAAEKVFYRIMPLEKAQWKFPKRLKPQFLRIIIHLMEELRQKERKGLLEDQRARVVQICYQLRERTGYDDSKAAEKLRQNMIEGDEILLGYLEKQAECGWRLPI